MIATMKSNPSKREEVEHLLARTGLKTEAVYADFAREPFGSQYPSELIFVARKAERASEKKHGRS